mmetsp:Transcript_89689/g.159341  ORF Transcript_89689/g.159341 Transcript_89689/m.159341 type:complete len:640 (+) Transcript_89689:96-2015(+)
MPAALSTTRSQVRRSDEVMSPKSPRSPLSPTQSFRSGNAQFLSPSSTMTSFKQLSATMPSFRDDASYLMEKKRTRRAALVKKVTEESPHLLSCQKCAEFKVQGEEGIRLLSLENEHLRRAIGSLMVIAEAALNEENFKSVKRNLHLTVRYFTGFGVEELEAFGEQDPLTPQTHGELARIKASRTSGDPPKAPRAAVAEVKKEVKAEEPEEPLPQGRRRLLGARDRNGPAVPKFEDKMIQVDLLEERIVVDKAPASEPAVIQQRMVSPKQSIPARALSPQGPTYASPDSLTPVTVEKSARSRRARIGTPLGGGKSDSAGSVSRPDSVGFALPGSAGSIPPGSPMERPTLQVQDLPVESVPEHVASRPTSRMRSPPATAQTPPRARVPKKKPVQPEEVAEEPKPTTQPEAAAPESKERPRPRQSAPEAEKPSRQPLSGSGPTLGASRPRAERSRDIQQAPEEEEEFRAPVETVDRCVGGGPGPGLEDLMKVPEEEPKASKTSPPPKQSKPSPEQLNKRGHMFDRKVRQGPSFGLMGASATGGEKDGDTAGPWAAGEQPSLAEFTTMVSSFRKEARLGATGMQTMHSLPDLAYGRPVQRGQKDVAQMAAELQAGNYEELVQQISGLADVSRSPSKHWEPNVS